MKVAFGMEDDEHLCSEHYGDSQFFLIYEIADGRAELIERRANAAVSMEETGHGDPRKFRAVLSQLEDVDALAAFRMGPNFVRIRDSTDKLVIFTRTVNLEDALKRVIEEIGK